jgi:hypothetical protein
MLGEFAPAHCLMAAREVGHRFVQIALIEKEMIRVLQRHIGADLAQRFRGLRSPQNVAIREDDSGLLVRPEVALRQLEAERATSGAGAEVPETSAAGSAEVAAGDGKRGKVTTATKPPLPRRFHGTVELDSERVGRDASQIADEVISHLNSLVGAEVRVTLEIDASIPTGAPEQVVRTVTENCKSLKFEQQGFEED